MPVPAATPVPPSAHDRFVQAQPTAVDRERLNKQTCALLVRAQQAEPVERRRIVDEVVESHLWLARSLAKRFAYRPQERDDLVQVACLGLVQACHRFDPAQPLFLAFAIPTVTGTLQRHLRDYSWSVRPPRPVQELAVRMNKQWGRLAQDLGAIPDSAGLAAQLGGGVSVSQVREARVAAAGRSSVSLDGTPSYAASWAAPHEPQEAAAEARLLLHKAWKRLSPEDRELLRLRFYEEQSQVTIAAALGFSQMHVSRRLARVLATLRAAIGDIHDGSDTADAV